MANEQLFKLNKQSKLLLIGFGMFLLGVVVGIVAFAMINEETGIFWVKPEMRMRALNYCVEHNYSDLEDVKYIQQTYYQIKCSRIADDNFVIDSFDVYPQELLKHG